MAQVEQSPFELEPGGRCWFDRLPSDALTVACGPTTDTGPDLAENPGGPPYFVTFALLEAGYPSAGRIELRGENELGILSYEAYPVQLFRPDGEKLDPDPR